MDQLIVKLWAPYLRARVKLQDSGAQALDTHNISRIEEDAAAGIDYVRDYYGVGAVADQAAPSLFAGQSNRAIQESEQFLQELQDGFDAGSFSETHYYGQLQTVVRALRTRYPGYNREIDGIIQSITGITPANSIISSLRRDIQTDANAVSRANAETSSFIEKNRGQFNHVYGVLNPNDPGGWEGLSAEEQNRLASHGSPVRTAVGAALGLEVARDNAQNRVALDSNEALSAWKDLTNQSQSEFMSTGNAFLPGGTMREGLNFATHIIEQGIIENIEQYEGFIRGEISNYYTLRQQYIDSAIELNVQDMDAVEEYLDTYVLAPILHSLEILGIDPENMGPVAINEFMLETIDSDLMRSFQRHMGGILFMHDVMNERIVPEFRIMYLSALNGGRPNDLQGPFWQPLVEFNLALFSDDADSSPELLAFKKELGLIRQDGTPVSFNEGLVILTKAADLEPNEAAAVYNAALNATVAVLLDEGMTSELMATPIAALFSREGGINLSDFEAREDQQEIYAMMTSPDITAAIRNTGTPQQWAEYTGWAVKNWANMNAPVVGEITRNMETLNAATTDTARQFFDLTFNVETAQFELTRNDVEVGPFMGAGGPEILTKEMQKNFQALNASLASIDVILETQGTNLGEAQLIQLFGQTGGIPDSWNLQIGNTDVTGVPIEVPGEEEGVAGIIPPPTPSPAAGEAPVEAISPVVESTKGIEDFPAPPADAGFLPNAAPEFPGSAPQEPQRPPAPDINAIPEPVDDATAAASGGETPIFNAAEVLDGFGAPPGDPDNLRGAVAAMTQFGDQVDPSLVTSEFQLSAEDFQYITNQYTVRKEQMRFPEIQEAMTGPGSIQDFLIERLIGHTDEHITELDQTFAGNLARLFLMAPAGIQAGLGIFSGYRSVARQTELWNEALRRYGTREEARKWVAPPGSSFHNHGLAADLGWNGGSLKDAPQEVIDWVHANASRVGLHFPLSNENWHIELIGTR